MEPITKTLAGMDRSPGTRVAGGVGTGVAPGRVGRAATALPPEILKAYADILTDLNRMATGMLGAVDELDIELYKESLRGIRSLEHLVQIHKEVRRRCKFRPVPAEFREIVAAVIGAEELPGYVRESRRVVQAPTRLLPSTGEGPGRAAARACVRGLPGYQQGAVVRTEELVGEMGREAQGI